MIISIDVEKAFDKIQFHSWFKKKTVIKVDREGIYLNQIEAIIYDKPTGNIIVNNENLKALPLKSGKRRMPTVTIST